MRGIFKYISRIYYFILNIHYRAILQSNKSTVFLGKIKIYNPQNISIGSKCSINEGVFFNVSNSLTIGNNVTISANVFITTTSLKLNELPIKKHFSKEIIIEDNVWIGAGAIILPGVRLQEGSVIGAGSIVTKDTEKYTIYAGNPAKKIRSLKK